MGKLRVIEKTQSVKNYHDEGYHIHKYYGLEDEELGIVIEPNFRNGYIQVLDNDNVFIKVDEGSDEWDCLKMHHFQRDNNIFVDKYKYSASGKKTFPEVERISIDTVLITVGDYHRAIYNLAKCKQLTVCFYKIGEFTGEEGERTAIVEISVPIAPFAKEPTNLLFAKIDEYGCYVGNFFDIDGNVYDISSEEYQEDGEFSDSKLVDELIRREKAREEARFLEEQRLQSIYFLSRKNEEGKRY